MSDELRLAREGFAAWQRGDFVAVEALLDPSAEWRWFEPGEWDCRNRADVMRTLRERHAQGFAQADLEFVDASALLEDNTDHVAACCRIEEN